MHETLNYRYCFGNNEKYLSEEKYSDIKVKNYRKFVESEKKSLFNRKKQLGILTIIIPDKILYMNRMIIYSTLK